MEEWATCIGRWSYGDKRYMRHRPTLQTWLPILSNLGRGLRVRFERTGREVDLEEAIRVSQQAVKATPSESPDMPAILNDLGTGLGTRFARRGRRADLEEAIRLWQQAEQLMSQDSPDLHNPQQL